jgi:hypothetical protein
MMRNNASLSSDQARWHVGKSRVHLATRPLLSQHDRPALIKTNNVERVLIDIEPNTTIAVVSIETWLWHPWPASIAGGAGGRPDHSINGRQNRAAWH